MSDKEKVVPASTVVSGDQMDDQTNLILQVSRDTDELVKACQDETK